MGFELDKLIFLIVALLIAITVHEFAHAWVANKLGDPTAKMLGRLTLNPISHIDIFGTIIVPFVLFLSHAPVFGWAKPVPYNPSFVKGGRLGEVYVAIAGPISNLLLAFVFALPARIFEFTNGASPSGQIYDLLAVIVILNVFLAAFNILPIPPLDGSKILYLILDSLGVSKHTIMTLERYGPIVLIFLIFGGGYIGLSVFNILEPVIYGLNWLVSGTSLP